MGVLNDGTSIHRMDGFDPTPPAGGDKDSYQLPLPIVALIPGGARYDTLFVTKGVEMYSSTMTFQGETAVSVLSSILKDTPAPLSESRGGIPPELDRIVRRCLAKDPERRYQTAADLRNDLEELQQQLGRPQPSSVRARARSSPGRVRA